MKLFKSQSELEKKQAQLERLFNKDFPWLWALCPDWSAEKTDIIISGLLHGVDLLRDYFGGRDTRAEVWCHAEYPGSNRQVVQVKLLSGTCWAESIYKVTPYSVISHMARVFRHYEEPEMTFVHVIRPGAGFEGFERAFDSIVARRREIREEFAEIQKQMQET